MTDGEAPPGHHRKSPLPRRGNHRSAVLPGCEPAPHHRPRPTTPRGGPCPFSVTRPVSRSQRLVTLCRGAGVVYSPSQARQPGMRCLIRNRPARGRGRQAGRSEDCRQTATGRLRKGAVNDCRNRHKAKIGLRPGQRGRYGPPWSRSGVCRLAAISPPVRGARPPSYVHRLRGVRQIQHGVPWPANPRCCGLSQPCRAACRRRRRGCRSRQGAAC